MYNLVADVWLFVAASQKESGPYLRMATGEKTSLKICWIRKNNTQVQKEKEKKISSSLVYDFHNTWT